MSLAAREKARSTPKVVALADERQQVTWAELDDIMNRAANALIATPGRAAVFANNSVEAVMAHLAGLHAAVSTIPVNFHFNVEETTHILTDSGASIVFVGPETAETGLAAAQAAGVETVVGWRSPPLPGLTAWEDWLAAGSPAEPPTHMQPKPHLHYTSGTTGRPKGVETPPTMFPRKENLEEFFAELRTLATAMGDRSPSLAVSPLYHTGPLGSVRMLGGGNAMVVMSRFDAEQVLAQIEKHKVKSTLMVPTHFQRLLALPPKVRAKYDVSSLVSVAHTGAACPVEVKRSMIEWFGPVLMEAYGATEAGSTNMISSEEWLLKPGSVGKTLPPFELVVVSDEGEILGPNQTGQLYFRDTTGRGVLYHNDEAKTASVHREPGVFTLGEIGHYDDDGYVFITDRSSDMIVSGGVNIYPAETEQVLIEHPAVSDVAVVGAPNAEMGEEVKAVIVLKDPSVEPSFAELDAFCRARLAGYKCPRSYDFSPDIGRNAMGKVNKRELRKRYWTGDRTIGG